MTNSKLNHSKKIIFFTISLLCFYFLNVFTNIAIDDFVYKHIITNNASEEGIRINSLADIFVSQYNHYWITNGRLLVNGLAQLFLIPDNKIYFNIVNTIIFAIFQLLLLKQFGNSLHKSKLHHYLILIVSLWFLIPGPNHTFLWLDGSINYLWATVLVLFFLDVYKSIYIERLFHKNVYLPLIFIFGFLCGFTHEVLTVGISGALFIDLIKNYKKHSIFSIVLLFGFFIGTFLMVIAPGNLIRLNAGNVEGVSPLMLIISKIGRLIVSFPNLLAFILMLFSLLIVFLKDKIAFRELYKKNELIIHSVFISLLFIVIAGAIEPRVFFGVAVFSLMILFSLINHYSNFFSSLKLKVSYVFLVLVMVFEYGYVIKDLQYNKTVFDADENIWRNSKENVFPFREKKINRFVCTGLGGSDRYFWSNKAMSWYYHKEYMIFLPIFLYENVYESNDFINNSDSLNSDYISSIKDSLKIYYSNKMPFLIFKTTNKNIKSIKSGAHILYEINEQMKTPVSLGLTSKIKNKIFPTKVLSIKSEIKPCFVLASKYQTYLISNSPEILPVNTLNKITFFAEVKVDKPLFLTHLNGN